MNKQTIEAINTLHNDIDTQYEIAVKSNLGEYAQWCDHYDKYTGVYNIEIGDLNGNLKTHKVVFITYYVLCFEGIEDGEQNCCKFAAYPCADQLKFCHVDSLKNISPWTFRDLFNLCDEFSSFANAKSVVGKYVKETDLKTFKQCQLQYSNNILLYKHVFSKNTNVWTKLPDCKKSIITQQELENSYVIGHITKAVVFE